MQNDEESNRVCEEIERNDEESNTFATQLDHSCNL